MLNDEAFFSKYHGCVFSQAEDFLVGVRVRTRNSPAGLLLGEIVLGCGPDDLGLPPSAACDVGPTVVYLKLVLGAHRRLCKSAPLAVKMCLAQLDGCERRGTCEGGGISDKKMTVVCGTYCYCSFSDLNAPSSAEVERSVGLHG